MRFTGKNNRAVYVNYIFHIVLVAIILLLSVVTMGSV